VEMHLVSRVSQRVRIPAADIASGDTDVEIPFEQGESIWTESSYKYTPSEIRLNLERTGFRAQQQWIDSEYGFALTLAEACG
jgi:L-histidine Nalpha-methyltransferase